MFTKPIIYNRPNFIYPNLFNFNKSYTHFLVIPKHQKNFTINKIYTSITYNYILSKKNFNILYLFWINFNPYFNSYSTIWKTIWTITSWNLSNSLHNHSIFTFINQNYLSSPSQNLYLYPNYNYIFQLSHYYINSIFSKNTYIFYSPMIT